MKANFQYMVHVKNLKEVHEIPGAWTESHFKELLKLIEYEDIDSISADELKEMTIMALSDLEPEDAAVHVLELRFGDKLNGGQRQNLSVEMKDDRIWEEYAEIGFHEELFHAACILHWAFPKVYSEPDVVFIQLRINAVNDKSWSQLNSPDASFVARLLNDGMDNHNTIYRLFDESLESDHFPEADDIIWQFKTSHINETEHSVDIDIYTSWNWVDELKGVREFESGAYSDESG